MNVGKGYRKHINCPLAVRPIKDQKICSKSWSWDTAYKLSMSIRKDGAV